MNAPQPNINYFAELSKQPRPYKMIPFPRKVNGKEFMIPLVMLTALENAQVKADAEIKTQQYLKEHTKEQTRGYKELFNDFCGVNIVWYSARISETNINTKFFPTKDSILEILSIDELGVLVGLYMRVQEELGPIIVTLTDDEVEKWIEKIIEDGTDPSFFFSVLSVVAQNQLVIGLVNRVKNTQMEKLSVG